MYQRGNQKRTDSTGAERKKGIRQQSARLHRKLIVNTLHKYFFGDRIYIALYIFNMVIIAYKLLVYRNYFTNFCV